MRKAQRSGEHIWVKTDLLVFCPSKLYSKFDFPKECSKIEVVPFEESPSKWDYIYADGGQMNSSACHHSTRRNEQNGQ